MLASAGIIGWDGPVVALSVKRDLYDTTAAARARRGELAVFDPGGVTGLPSARWTPLRDVTTTSGAARAGRALAQAIPRNGVTGGDFWASHGETLTSAYMSLAGLSQLVGGKEDEPREPLTKKPGRRDLRALRSAGPGRGRCDGRLRRSDRDPLPPHLPVAGRVRGRDGDRESRRDLVRE